ncbi:hypothetical protein OG473_04820 [Streptomyces anulatus]|uniref:hypothetical protein n=1 Tax=Streptomyces anulatus TaxID=1892 RepID=UPI00324939A0|nr:hypothetical protein OG238_35850 [Streptomyces anulatus]WSU33088.1 hypothetical protein OG391_33860 [Streptomyces anulatus]WSU87994.1 hypothetical protein OG575_04770 [Streptomyces anulatus]
MRRLQFFLSESPWEAEQVNGRRLERRASRLQLHAQPYTPAHHFTRGRSDPAFRTKPAPPAARADLPCGTAPTCNTT